MVKLFVSDLDCSEEGIKLGNSVSDSNWFEINENKRYTGAIKGIAQSSSTRVIVSKG